LLNENPMLMIKAAEYVTNARIAYEIARMK